MLKKVFYILLIVIICPVLLKGCKNLGIEYSVGFSDNVGFGIIEIQNGGITIGLIEIVNSLDELETLCEEWNNPAFDEDNDDYSSELSEKIREYNEEFFENKALIINSSCQYNSKREPGVDKLIIEEDKLIIEVSLKRGTYTDIAESWLFLIEVNKADIIDITNITIENTLRSKYK